MMTINLNVPKGWHELTQKQLRYLLFLLSEEYTATAIKTLCLFRWASLRVLNYADDGILLQLNKTQFFINALQIAEAVSSLSWMDELPKIPVRIESIGKHYALKAGFQGVPFETFIVCENLYQGFLHTKNEDYGTGRETPRGNSGDIGRDKVRKRRRWFSRKYYASVMNIRDFFADNLGKEYQGIIADSFNDKISRRNHNTV